MNILCVDDEQLQLTRLVSLCRELPEVRTAEGFTRSADALSYVKSHAVDLAFLDIDMPDMNGLRLAAEIRTASPRTAIVFITGYSQYAVEAFRLRAVGYLLKPVDREQLVEELAYVRELRGISVGGSDAASVYVQTFGNFDLLVQGRSVTFERSRSREILAYLVMKNGTSVTRAELAALFWPDEIYDHSHQKQMDVFIRSLRSTLQQCGAGEILEMSRNGLRVRPDRFSCDFYRFLQGDPAAVNAYCGEFMNNYSWAEFSAALLDAHYLY